MDLQKPGSFNIDVAYYDVEQGLYHKDMSGLDIDGDIFLQDANFWLATGDVALMETYISTENMNSAMMQITAVKKILTVPLKSA